MIPNKYIPCNPRLISATESTVDKYKSVFGSKDLDKYAPSVLGGSTRCLRRFKPSKKIIDSYHHNQGIRVAQYANNQIIALDNIADSICFYNLNSQLVRTLSPKKENHIVDTAILYFAYSHLEKRVS